MKNFLAAVVLVLIKVPSVQIPTVFLNDSLFSWLQMLRDY